MHVRTYTTVFTKYIFTHAAKQKASILAFKKLSNEEKQLRKANWSTIHKKNGKLEC